jgi:hypothetical protein
MGWSSCLSLFCAFFFPSHFELPSPLIQHRARQLDRHLFLDQKQQQQQQQPQGNPQLQPPLLPQHQQQQPMEGAVEGSRQWHEAMTEEAYHATQVRMKKKTHVFTCSLVRTSLTADNNVLFPFSLLLFLPPDVLVQ